MHNTGEVKEEILISRHNVSMGFGSMEFGVVAGQPSRARYHGDAMSVPLCFTRILLKLRVGIWGGTLCDIWVDSLMRDG